jgi:cardiolipin synthase A/B
MNCAFARKGLFVLLGVLACSSQEPTPLGPALADSGFVPDLPADDAGTSTDDGAVAVVLPAVLVYSNKLRVIPEPTDNGAALLAAVKAAKTSILVEMYLLTNTAFIDALIAQKRAGRVVKVVLNQQFPVPIDDNQATFAKLQGAGVSIVWAAPTFTYTHTKTVVIDAKQAWIMTMNVTQSSASSNREFLVVDDEPADVAEATAVLEADYAKTAFTAVSRLVASPLTARPKLLALVASATRSIEIEAEALSDYELVTALIAKQKSGGVSVRVIISSEAVTQSGTSAAVQRLKTGGVLVRSLADPTQHSKALVVDGIHAYAGSTNFTRNSMDNNRELGVLFDQSASVKVLEAAFATDYPKATPL